MRTWNPHWMVKVLLFTAGAIFVSLCAFLLHAFFPE